MQLMSIYISTRILIHLAILDFSIDVNKKMDRLCKKPYRIHKLDTLYPKGVNSKWLYYSVD